MESKLERSRREAAQLVFGLKQRFREFRLPSDAPQGPRVGPDLEAELERLHALKPDVSAVIMGRILRIFAEKV